MDESERTVVTTYLPKHQKSIWEEHAQSLDMSQSEFVKTMVQAGRRRFDAEDEEGPISVDSTSNPGGQTDENDDPNDYESIIVEALEEQSHLTWDDLVEIVTSDLESELADAISRLQERNEIRHDPRVGGYVREEN